MRPLVVTGGTGFVGRRLLTMLPPDREVRLVVREPSRLGPLPPAWTIVTADLVRSSLDRALDGADTILHLAARTGSASAQVHQRDNTEVTGRLLEAACRGGVHRFCFVSSIAAGYPDRRHYHYANAKLAAEALVNASGLKTLIVRPTMILGAGSPVIANLAKLACLPRPILFGGGTGLQPVHVDDVATALAAAVTIPEWTEPLVEYGGPERISTAELFARIRAQRSLPPARPITVPVEPLRALLALVEPIVGRWLPFRAGQLAAFTNPSVVTIASRSLPAPTRSLAQMLADS